MSFVPLNGNLLAVVGGNSSDTDGTIKLYQEVYSGMTWSLTVLQSLICAGQALQCLFTNGGHWLLVRSKNTPYLTVFQDGNTVGGDNPSYSALGSLPFDDPPTGIIKYIAFDWRDLRKLCVLTGDGIASDQIWVYHLDEAAAQFIKIAQIDATVNSFVPTQFDQIAVSHLGKYIYAIGATQGGTPFNVGAWKDTGGSYAFSSPSGPVSTSATLTSLALIDSGARVYALIGRADGLTVAAYDPSTLGIDTAVSVSAFSGKNINSLQYIHDDYHRTDLAIEVTTDDATDGYIVGLPTGTGVSVGFTTETLAAPIGLAIGMAASQSPQNGVVAVESDGHTLLTHIDFAGTFPDGTVDFVVPVKGMDWQPAVIVALAGQMKNLGVGVPGVIELWGTVVGGALDIGAGPTLTDSDSVGRFSFLSPAEGTEYVVIGEPTNTGINYSIQAHQSSIVPI